MNLPPDRIAELLAWPGATDAYGRPLRSVAEVVADTIAECDFQKMVTDLADANQWNWHHQTISRRSKSGWLDLPLWREAQAGLPGRFLIREIKTESGIVSAAQASMIDSLRAAGVDAGVWRPSDWATIVSLLEGKP